jgi:hypothetical protein
LSDASIRIFESRKPPLPWRVPAGIRQIRVFRVALLQIVHELMQERRAIERLADWIEVRGEVDAFAWGRMQRQRCTAGRRLSLRARVAAPGTPAADRVEGDESDSVSIVTSS